MTTLLLVVALVLLLIGVAIAAWRNGTISDLWTRYICAPDPSDAFERSFVENHAALRARIRTMRKP